jgi:hypothetical protein
VPNRACLAGKAAALDGGDHVILAVAVGGDDRLAQHHLEHGTREIRVELLVVDDDLAGAGLDPDACDGVLALAGGISAAALVELLDVDGCGRLCGFAANRSEVLEGIELSH